MAIRWPPHLHDFIAPFAFDEDMTNTDTTTTNSTNTTTNHGDNHGDNTATTSSANGSVRKALAFGAGIVATIAAGITFAAVGADAAGGAHTTIGDDEATFVPITPCRLFDTRPDFNVGPRSTPLGSGEIHTQQVTGTNGDCTIPAGATGIALNATAVDATAPSFATFYPADAPRPSSSNLNYLPGQAPTPNKVDVKLSADGKVAIYNAFGDVHMLADVTGYYTSEGLQALADLADDVVAAAATLTAGQPQITSGFSDGITNIGGDPTIVASVDVTPTTSGKVIVNSSALASSLTVGAEMRCAISADVSIPSGRLQGWEAAGVSPYIGQLAGTAVFNVTSTNPRTYHLVCQHSGPGDANIANAHISAIYVPGAFVSAT